jgi:general secretion pathway protein K
MLHHNLFHRISEFAVGLLFGMGLMLSGMTDPGKVIGFLDIAGSWDPSLALVMGGAIAVGFFAFALAKKRTSNFLGGMLRLPTNSQNGAALLMAMLTVALVAVLASAALWQQWRTLSVESAERNAQQTAWLLRGAQDWASVVLREDGRAGSTDHLAEPWAVPLREARLSAFLAAGNNGAVNDSDGLTEQVFLSGRITDMQSRLNVTNLLDGSKLNERNLLAFARLYRALGLPEAELRQWTTALLAAAQTPPRLARVVARSHPALLRARGTTPLQLGRLAGL